jgi:hypothetical protein
MAGKNCAICGKPSKFYELCLECNKLKDEGKVIKCESCGTWHYADKPCACQKIASDTTANTKCIICEEDSNGLLFCKKCYYKYKDKEILLRITNCKNIELLDYSYEGKYKCIDGHMVKSKSEREIDNYLFHHGIPHAYERDFPIDDKKENCLHPDFYLSEQEPKGKVYLEHWGFDESHKSYTESKEYKIEKYKEKGITLICTSEKEDSGDIESALDRKLGNYKHGEINFL